MHRNVYLYRTCLKGILTLKIDQLKEDPNLLEKALVAPLKEFRSVRAAGQRYRIIYKIVEKEIYVVVAVGIRKSGDKKDIYELMKKYIKNGLLEV